MVDKDLLKSNSNDPEVKKIEQSIRPKSFADLVGRKNGRTTVTIDDSERVRMGKAPLNAGKKAKLKRELEEKFNRPRTGGRDGQRGGRDSRGSNRSGNRQRTNRRQPTRP